MSWFVDKLGPAKSGAAKILGQQQPAGNKQQTARPAPAPAAPQKSAAPPPRASAPPPPPEPEPKKKKGWF